LFFSALFRDGNLDVRAKFQNRPFNFFMDHQERICIWQSLFFLCLLLKLIFILFALLNACKRCINKDRFIKNERRIWQLVQNIDNRCDNRRFWLSAHNCQVPTPTSQNLELEQQIRIFRAD
jgi:hypothetical protein